MNVAFSNIEQFVSSQYSALRIFFQDFLYDSVTTTNRGSLKERLHRNLSPGDGGVPGCLAWFRS